MILNNYQSKFNQINITEQKNYYKLFVKKTNKSYFKTIIEIIKLI